VDAPFYKKTINVSKFETEKINNSYIMKPVDLQLTQK